MHTAGETIRTIDLGYEQMLVFDGGRAGRVRVLYGATWLTEEGVARDAIVRAGEEVALLGSNGALLEALAPTRVQIIEARSRRRSAGVLLTLRRGLQRLQQAIQRLHLGARPAVGSSS